jgi:hypothetical protein
MSRAPSARSSANSASRSIENRHGHEEPSALENPGAQSVVVIQEQREPGVDSVFWKDAKETGRDVLPMTHA